MEERFYLRWSGDEIQANLSLQAFLSRNFELKLPEISDFESLDIDTYLSAMESMIDGKENWAILRNDAVLGLFSFAKFMMYRDLDPEQWKCAGGLEASSWSSRRRIISCNGARACSFLLAKHLTCGAGRIGFADSIARVDILTTAAGIHVHVGLETLTTMSRNMHLSTSEGTTGTLES